MIPNSPAPGTVEPPLQQTGTRPPRRPGINWFRFWIQMLVAMVVFNVIAGLVTWFFIFPHLHPAH